MRFIEGKKQRYLLKDETLKECDAGDYFLKEEDHFVVGLYYNDGNETKQITKYIKEYSKKVSSDRLEQIIREYYDKDKNRLQV